jgi:hypothetical protein
MDASQTPRPNKVPKYSRWHIDEATLAVLKSLLEQTDMPDAEQLSSLACLFNVSVRRVRVWFQNQRQRGRETKTLHETSNECPAMTSQPTQQSMIPIRIPIVLPICLPHRYERSHSSTFATLAESMLRDESD